ARQKLTKNPEDKMWMNITKVLNTTLGWNAGINTNLLNEILGFPDDSDLSSQRIEVPDEIKDAFGEGIAKTSGGLRLVSSNLTLRDHLEVLGELEKINQCLDNLPEVLRPFLAQESGKQMVHDLSVRLIDSGAHVSIVRAYLGDEQQIVSRLYYHADLDSIIFQHTELSRQVKSRMDSQRAAVMSNINSSYGVTELLPRIDSFSDSCDSFQDSGRMSWRELIFGELSTDPDFQKLIKARIKEDTKLQGFTLERYSEWIREPLSPIGLPEVTVLSKITGRPVLIVRLGMGNFKWIDGINLDFAKEPIILNVNEEEMWAPVERI
ncbi:MAG TPA: hypothetical protein VIJ14_01645, partial [Rhabdochlamydiaceae bacterium]